MEPQTTNKQRILNYGTIVFVVHDRYAIHRIATRVIEIRDRGLHPVNVEVPA